MQELISMARKLSRPTAGAAVILRSLQPRKGRSIWVERLFGSAGWLLVVTTAVVLWLPWPNKVAIDVNPIKWVLGIFVAYLLILEMSSRAFRERYDLRLSRLLRIIVVSLVVSALVWFSGGAGSYFWFFYSLPILQTILYFGARAVQIVGIAIIDLYWGISILAAECLAQSPDFALLIVNSLVLLILSFLVNTLFEAAKASRKVEHFEALQEAQDLAPSVDTQQDLDNLHETVVRLALKVTKAAGGSIMLLDRQSVTLELAHRYPPTRPWWKEVRQFKLGEGIAGWVAKHKEALICPDVLEEPRFAPAMPEGSIRSLLAVPIITHGRVLGVISVDSPLTDLFDANDEQVLRALASYFASRFERARLLEALHVLGESAILNLSDALQVILEQLARVVDYDSAAIWLDEDGRAKIVAARGFQNKQEIEGLAYEAAGDLLHQEMSRTQRPVLIKDARKDTRYRGLGGSTWVQGWLGVPLLVKGEMIGSMTLDSRHTGHFDQGDVELVGVFARQAAITIEDSRLHQRQQRWAKELETLQKLGLDITAEAKGSRLVETIIKRAVELLHAQSGGIFRYDPEDRELTVIGDWGANRSIVGTSLRIGEGMAGRVVETQEPFIVDDYGSWPGHASIYEPYLCRATVAVPLRWKESIQGVLYVTDDTEARAFTTQDAELLELLANQATIAMENARLLEEARQQAQDLQELAQQLRLVHKMMTLVSSKLDTGHILETTAKELARVFGVTQCGVVILDHDAGFGRLLAQFQEAPDSTGDELKIPLEGNASMEWILNHKRPLAIEDAREDPLLAGIRDIIEARGIVSILILPLLVDGEVFGTIGLDAQEGPRQFTKEEINLAWTIAKQVAMAIENAQLFAQTQRRALALSELHSASLAITGYHQIRELLDSILDRAAGLLKAKGGGLYLTEESGEQLRLTAVWKMPQEFVGTVVEAGHGVVGRVVKDKSSLSVSNYQDWPDRLHQYDQQALTAVVGAPLIWRGKVLGAIAVHDTEQGRVFDKEEEHLLSHLANLAAVALENARQVDELERLMDSAIEALIVVDEDGMVTKLNERAESILCYEADEVLGQSIKLVLHDPHEVSRVKKALREGGEGRIADLDTLVRSKYGERIPIRLTASPLFDYQGRRVGSVGRFQDLREIESARRQIRHLRGLFAAGRAITSQLDLRRVLEAIVSKAMEALDEVDAIVLYPYDAHKQEFRAPPIIEGVNKPEFLKGSFRVDSVVTRLMGYGEDHFAESAIMDPIMRGDFVRREDIESSAGVLLEVGGETVGAMFFNYRKRCIFSEEERNVISILATQAAIAIQNARLYELEQQRARHLDSMHRVSMAADAAANVSEVLQSTLAVMVQELGMEQGGVMLFDVKEDFGRTVAEYPGEKKPDLYIALAGNASLEWILEHKQPLAIADCVNDPRLNEIREAIEAWGVVSMLLVPLLVRDEIIGTVGLDAIGRMHEFTPEEIKLAEMMTRQMATALENSRAREDLSAIQTVNSAFVLLSRWAHRVRQKSYALGHSLRSLRKALPIGLFDELLEPMEESIQELSLPAAVLQAEDLAEKAAVVDVANLLLDVTKRLCKDRKVSIEPTCELDGGPYVAAINELLLEIAVEMLVENAVESIEDKGQPGTVHVRCRQLNGRINVRISDTGSGIDRQVLEGLFHAQVASKRGHGYGSLTAASVIRAYGGDIRVVRTGSEGTHVEFEIPAFQA